MGKAKAKPITEEIITNLAGETVLLWKAKMPLSDSEHEQLSNRLRFEQEHSGVKIILVPYPVDAEVSIESNSTTDERPEADPKPDEATQSVSDSEEQANTGSPNDPSTGQDNANSVEQDNIPDQGSYDSNE